MLERIKEDLKKAMLSRDEVATSTLRLLISELNNAKIAKGGELTDEEVIAVVLKEVKKRKEASEGFRKGSREDQALKEEAEMKILEKYLPAQISQEELQKVVEDTINELGTKSLLDMGKVIGVVMGKVGQSAQGGRVSNLVKERLSS